MVKNRRNGNRKTREQTRNFRIPNLGYYFIVTDTKKTEENYMKGLRDSIPLELQGKLVIKVSKAETRNLVEEAKSLMALHPQYGEPWIVFDRDQVKNFDHIIEKAIDEKINVGWSNPCIEIWFSAYFGTMPTYQGSVECCSKFAQQLESKTNFKYAKADKDIYNLLCKYGDEDKALLIAERKLNEQLKNYSKPSEMCPATTLHMLIGEIKDKITPKYKL